MAERDLKLKISKHVLEALKAQHKLVYEINLPGWEVWESKELTNYEAMENILFMLWEVPEDTTVQQGPEMGFCRDYWVNSVQLYLEGEKTLEEVISEFEYWNSVF